MPTRTLGGMATYPGRAATLDRVLRSIAPQLDVLYLYLNGYDEVPDWLRSHPNVQPVLAGDARGELSASGKMVFLAHEHEGLAFTLDDDILYPPDYVQAMQALRAGLPGPVGLCVHGSVIPAGGSWYYERSRVYDAQVQLHGLAPVNLVGSGTFCFALGDVPLSFEDFTATPMVDLLLSIRFLEHGVPLAAVPRPAHWIEFLPYEGMTRALKRDVTHHSLALRDAAVLSPAHAARLWRQLAARDRAGSVAELVHGRILPGLAADFSNTAYSVARTLEFTRMWTR